MFLLGPKRKSLTQQKVQSTLVNHMKGAVNHGATLEEVNAVRSWVMIICELAGMTELKNQTEKGRWGWQTTVAKL